MLKATRILHHLHSGSNETFRGAGNKRGSSIATRRSTVVLRDVLVRINACTVVLRHCLLFFWPVCGNAG